MYKEFSYLKATSLQEAFAAMARRENVLLYAGGTDILVKLRALQLSPDTLLDVKAIPGFRDIRESEREIVVGAAVTHSEVEESAVLRQWCPALCAGVGQVGSVPIRNKATLAGNIQNASPVGDGLVAATGLDAEVIAASAEGERRIPLCGYCTAPGKTLLQKNEIITGVAFPKHRWTYQRFFKVGKRNALAISVINGLVAVDLAEDGRVADCRIVIGAAAPIPLRIPEAEALLRGKKLDDGLIAGCAACVQGVITPISDVRASAAYRNYIAGAQVQKALWECREGLV